MKYISLALIVSALVTATVMTFLGMEVPASWLTTMQWTLPILGVLSLAEAFVPRKSAPLGPYTGMGLRAPPPLKRGGIFTGDIFTGGFSDLEAAEKAADDLEDPWEPEVIPDALKFPTFNMVPLSPWGRLRNIFTAKRA